MLPSTNDGVENADLHHNLAMLSRIAGNVAMKSVVATNGWDQIARATQLPVARLVFVSRPVQMIRRHEIMDTVLEKNPEPLHIQIELEADKDLASTTASID
jgi:hypothetical protein